VDAVNAERAETFLRTLAEARLRQILTAPASRRDDIAIGVNRAADALVEVSAIDPSLAQAIVADFRQALDSRSGAATTRPRLRPGPGGARRIPARCFFPTSRSSLRRLAAATERERRSR
jgi:hypothetical protein